MTTRSIRLSIGVGILAVGLGAPAFAQMAPSSVPQKGLPPALQNVGFDPQLDAQLPLDLPFTDEAARSVRLGDYFGRRPIILAFVYYDCPMLCNQVEESLVGALKMISFTAGREYEVVFVSFDPRETPDMAAEKKARALENYARSESAPGWHFLTGSPESVAALTRAANFRYTFDEKTKLFAHASGILVLTPQGRISRSFFGVDYPPRDLRLGLVEASANKIGTPADRLVLYCYQYDPASAKYSATILGLVRLGGVITVLAILIGIVVFRRHEARASRGRSQGA
jgi:protein SCO1/2